MVDSILVSVDFSNKNDTGVMVVGRKRMNQSVEIINAFQGDEARFGYNTSDQQFHQRPVQLLKYDSGSSSADRNVQAVFVLHAHRQSKLLQHRSTDR